MWVVVVLVVVMVRVLTGLRANLSRPRFTRVAAAGLAVSQLDPVVAQQEPRLASEGHGLAEVGKEVTYGSWHATSLSGPIG